MSIYNYTQTITPPQQVKKIFCAYHRTEFLTNFCTEKQCLMPMCPSCVAEHTEYHNKSSQRPSYINLQDALQQTKQNCYTAIVNLQEMQRKNVPKDVNQEQVFLHTEELPYFLHEQLTSVKEKVFEHIQTLFQDYEAEILRDVERRYEEGRVYNKEQSEEIRNTIMSCIDSLYDKIGVLKGDQCLAGLITYFGEDQKSYEDVTKEVDQYLARHKATGKINIHLAKSALATQLEGLCYKILTPGMSVDTGSHSYEPMNENQSLKRNVAASTSRLPKNSGVVPNSNTHRMASMAFNNRPESRVNINRL